MKRRYMHLVFNICCKHLIDLDYSAHFKVNTFQEISR